MKAEDFLHLASVLSRDHGEAGSRTGVSRAYYAAFHQARSLVDACGVACPASHDAHTKIVYCLDNTGDAVLRKSAAKLSSLRTARNHADYDLEDRRFARSDFAELQVQIAQQLFGDLLAAHARKASFREPLRDYARRVLRLAVRDEGKA